MSRKKETITLSIPPETKERLEAIARRLGIFWGKSPSISGLLVAIAQQQPEARKLFILTPEQIAALQPAIKVLIDTGYIAEAQTLLNLLLEQGNLEQPLHQALTHLLNQPSQAWRTTLEQYCQHQQPFQLLYGNAQRENLRFTVRYAEISFEEKRFYLNVWCEETEDIKNPEFPQLIHNRCLRLDRIQQIEQINQEWRHEGLDYLEVYLHFYNGMVKAYEPKQNDISNEIIGDVRQVVRKVVNPFWLIREVRPYGKDCVIVSPESMRDRYKQELRALCKIYDI